MPTTNSNNLDWCDHKMFVFEKSHELDSYKNA